MYRNDNCKHKQSIRDEIVGAMVRKFNHDDEINTFTLPALNFKMESVIKKCFPFAFMCFAERDVKTSKKQIEEFKKEYTGLFLNGDAFQLIQQFSPLPWDVIWMDLCSNMSQGLLYSIIDMFHTISLGSTNNGAIIAITVMGGREYPDVQRQMLDTCLIKNNTPANRLKCRNRDFPKYLANILRSRGLKVNVIVRNYIPQSRTVRHGPYMYTYIYNIN